MTIASSRLIRASARYFSSFRQGLSPRLLASEQQQQLRQPEEHDPYYITTPIFYPNADPHIGHLYSLAVADTFARHARLSAPKRRVVFTTGTDEHGMKIQKAAQDRGLEPRELCDRLSLRFSNLAMKASISNTDFIRTTSPQHYEGVQVFWDILMQRGHIYKGKHSGWYSISDEAFYTEPQVCTKVDEKTGKEVKVSIETGSVVEWTEEENYKFSLSSFKSQLRDHFLAHPNAIYPPSQYKVIMDMLEDDDPRSIPDLSISRPSSRLKWGIPVPGDDSQTIYVWLDALLSYLTSVGFPWSNPREWLRPEWPVDLQIIGKDILRFHAIYFPAFLMAADLPLPQALISHAHWTVDKAKMSKSLGNVVNPFDILRDHGVDVVRWYFARAGGYFKSDVDWNAGELKKYKLELRNLIGNILLRLQSDKIHARLPTTYKDIPLRRDVLLNKGNASSSLPDVGTSDYKHLKEDREFLKVRDFLQGRNLDYSCEYTDGPAQEPFTSEDGRILYYSDLPDASVDEELVVSSKLRTSLDQLRGKICYHMKRFEVSEATQSIVDVLTELNKEITRIQPWSKNTNPQDIGQLLIWSRETLRICGIMLQPYLPISSQALLDALRIESNSRTYADARVGWGRVRPGRMQRVILYPNSEQVEQQSIDNDYKFDERRMRRISPKVATCDIRDSKEKERVLSTDV